MKDIEIQEIFLPLLTDKKRYKLYHGGRGGGKSYAFADCLLILGSQKNLRIACVREVQASIKDSVYQLLKDRCEILGFTDYIFFEDRIENARTKTTFIFKGMNNTNAANIKSLEGINICWCFVAGTKVDDKNIEDIRVGDYIRSFNHKTKEIEYKKVLRIMRHKTPEKIIRLTFNGLQPIIGTANHPIYVKDKGYVPLKNVKSGDIVYAEKITNTRQSTLLGRLRRNDTTKHNIKKTGLCEKWWNILQRLQKPTKFGTYEKTQSNGQSRNSGKNEKNNNQKRLQTQNTWGKWTRLFQSTRAIMENTWSWLVGRITNSNRSLYGQRGLADKLQSGHCEYILRDSDRGGRWKSLWCKVQRRRQKENRVLTEQRVDSVEILQQGSLKQLGLRDEGNFVYNLEVQDNNNYFANGVLVHNCEEAQKISEKSWKVLDPTIRKEGSEIWLSMNRELEFDPVWKALAVNPDTEKTLIVKVNYYDNKYCPKVLIDQAEHMKETDYMGYLHVWEGEPEQDSDKKLISLVSVKRALENKIVTAGEMPLILGVDVARFGDDKTAVARRRGRECFRVHSYAKLSITAVANMIKNIILEEHPAIVNIDIGGLGAGVYDILMQDGFNNVVRGVNFGEQAQEVERYFNRRAEMWARMRDWLDGDLPVSLTDCDGLLEDLTAPQKFYDKIGRLRLEKKDDIKVRIGRSTDVGDALALTFAEREYPKWLITQNNVETDFVDDNVYVE